MVRAVSGHTVGLKPWLLQRISAVYLALFFVYLFVHFYLYPFTEYSAWQEWIARPLVGTAFAGFILALLVHAWVGLRDVVLDYFHHLGLRLTVLVIIAFILIGCGFWSLRVLILAGLAI
jgi:succinate dehydrogenase / fumarate reductase membrane anchor subunit